MGRKISSDMVHRVDPKAGFPEDSCKISCQLAEVIGGERCEEPWQSPQGRPSEKDRDRWKRKVPP